MTTLSFIHRTCAAVSALGLSVFIAACTLEGQGAPSLSGPSEFGLSLTANATPDQLFRNGTAESTVTVVATGADGKPLAGQSIAIGVSSQGTTGKVTADVVTAGADGRATFGVIAPPADSAGDEIIVELRPIGTNAGNTVPRRFIIGVYPSNPTAPTAAFTVTPPTAVVNQTVTFNASASTDDGAACTTCVFEWSFGDGNGGSGMVTTHRYSTSGVMLVTLTVRDRVGATATYTQSITVSALAPPTISVSPNPPVINNAATFTVVATMPPGVVITKYTWTWGDGTTTESTSAVASHTYTSLGAKTVTVSVEDSLGNTSEGILGITVVNP
jgi:PKD repeat protein